MQNLKRTPRHSILTALAVAAAISALLYLGFWQLERAAMQESRFEVYQQKRAMSPVRLNDTRTADTPTDDLLWRSVIVQGKFSGSRVYLLDNQVQNGQPGYHVLSPFSIAGSDKAVLVNRGWVASGPFRERLPEIATPQGGMTVQGVVYLPQDNDFSKGYVEFFDNDVVRIQVIDLNTLADDTAGQLLPYLIRLDPSSPGGFERTWPEPGSGRERHLGYAFQWFMLALVLAIIYFARAIKRFRADA